MKLNVALALIRVLGFAPDAAKTVRELAEAWPTGGRIESRVRRMHAWINDLAAGDWEMGVPALLNQIESSEGARYYLNADALSEIFMTEQSALFFILAHPALGPLGVAGQISPGLRDLAARRLQTSGPRLKRLQERVRVVPDGIGRLYATVDQAVLTAAIDALSTASKITIDYRSARGHEAQHTVDILGLVAKDRTAYLIGSPSLGEQPRHYAMHRITSASISTKDATIRNFDLDRYIQETHQLSHPLSGGAIRLQLLVAPEALYHFEEWPLTDRQKISAPDRDDGWRRVDAEVPESILLAPWLLSMGPWIKVLGPDSVREEVAGRVRRMAEQYV